MRIDIYNKKKDYFNFDFFFLLTQGTYFWLYISLVVIGVVDSETGDDSGSVVDATGGGGGGGSCGDDGWESSPASSSSNGVSFSFETFPLRSFDRLFWNQTFWERKRATNQWFNWGFREIIYLNNTYIQTSIRS